MRPSAALYRRPRARCSPRRAPRGVAAADRLGLLLPVVRDDGRGRELRPLGAVRPRPAERHRLGLLPGARRLLLGRPDGARRADGRDPARRDQPDRRLVVGAGITRGSAPAGDRSTRGAARGIDVAVHIEPYSGRTVASVDDGHRLPGGARDPTRSTSTRRSRVSAPAAGRPRTTPGTPTGMTTCAPDRARRAGGRRTLQRRLHLRHRHLGRRRSSPASAREAHRHGPPLRAVGRAGVRRPPRDRRPAREAAARRRDLRLDVARGDRGRSRRGHDHVVQRVAGGNPDRAGGAARPARRLRLHLATTAPGGSTGVAAEPAYLDRTAYWVAIYDTGVAIAAVPRTHAAYPCRGDRRATVSRPLAQLPNALTVARLVVIPVYARADPLARSTATAGRPRSCSPAAAVTDQIDGFLARRWHVESQFGKIADPLADRLLIDVAVVLLWHAGQLPWAAFADPGARHPRDRGDAVRPRAAATSSRSTASGSSRPGSST